jgi:hypothetical protein
MLSSPVRGNTISGARAGISTKITQNSYKVPLDI